MKSQQMQIFFKTCLLIMSLWVFGCAKKDSSSVRWARGTSAGVSQNNTNNGMNNTPSTCANASMDWGRIYDSGSSSNFDFEAQVKGFISATLDPQSFGSISGDLNGETGIDFKGSFKFDGQGNLDAKNSSVEIKIVDSYVNQVFEGTIIEPYVVQFSQATSGRLDRATGELTVTFQDSYGVITFQGILSGTLVDGVVHYQNTRAVSGASVSSGTLGQFKAYACSLIK